MRIHSKSHSYKKKQKNKSSHYINETKASTKNRQVDTFLLCQCSALTNNDVIKHNLNNYGLIWFFKISMYMYYNFHMCYIFWPSFILILRACLFGLNFINVEIGYQTIKCLYIIPRRVRVCPLIHLTMQFMYITCCSLDKRI